MPARATSSVEYLISEIKRHKTGAVIGLIGILALLVFGSFVGYQMLHSVASVPVLSLERLQFTRLTATGKVFSCAISPDGKYFGYTSNDGGGKHSLFLQQLGSASSLTLVPSTDTSYSNLSFSPDGGFLYYIAIESSDRKKRKLYQIPSLGGPARLIDSNIVGTVAVAPNGRDLSFLRIDPTNGEYQIAIRDLKSAEERVLVTLKGSFRGLAWSPDSKILALSMSEIGEDKQQNDHIRLINVSSGKIEDWPKLKIRYINQLVWVPDQSGFYFVGTNAGSLMQVWHIAYPSGALQRWTSRPYRRVRTRAPDWAGPTAIARSLPGRQ